MERPTYFRKKAPGGHTYLQIVESRRKGDQVRQQVIATLGRVDELQASGQLERLLRPGARLAAKAMVLSATSDDATKIAVRRIGPVLVFERLWEETGCHAIITDLAGERGHKFRGVRCVGGCCRPRYFPAQGECDTNGRVEVRA
jgi:hypothetical protein